MDRKEKFIDKFKAMSEENRGKVIDVLVDLMHEPTTQELMDVFKRMVDDNNYLPGQPTVIVSMPIEDHDLIEKIYYWWRDEVNGERGYDEMS